MGRGKKAPSRNGKRRRNGRDPRWVALPDSKLLELPLNRLDVKIEGTWLQDMVERLYDELWERGLTFRPHCWISNEWFSPDGVPGIAIPFYLAHRRLMMLERRQMLEVEGGTKEGCMRILRHEAGHAFDTAYRLRRKRKWQAAFGLASQAYPTHYKPKPHSRKYVLHLDWWYAQSHPVEDFAETFAVWLKPGSKWRRDYAGWPALQKLHCVDELMNDIAGRAPVVRSRARVDALPRLRHTLQEHYCIKRSHYGADLPDFYDQDLLRLFGVGSASSGRESASAFLRRARLELRNTVSHWTGQHPYTIEQVLKEMINRSRALDLHLIRSERETKLDTVTLLTVQVMRYLQKGGYQVAL